MVQNAVYFCLEFHLDLVAPAACFQIDDKNSP